MQRLIRPLALFLALAPALTGCTKTQFAATPVQGPDDTQQLAQAIPADLVTLDAAAANRYITAGTAAEVVMRLRITTKAQTDQPRPHANIALVIDTSASMKGEAIEQARQAGLAMLEALEPGDRISVVAFHSRADILVPSTEISAESRPTIRAAIEGMQAVGTTALAQGLSEGLNQVQPFVRPDLVSRIVLLSDGLPNDEAPVRAIAQQAAAYSIGIAALGLGVGYHEALLADVASLSGGRFHYIEDADQVASMFREEVLHIDRLVATGATLTLAAGPGITIDEVVGHTQPGLGQPSASIMVGDLAEDETKDIVVRLAVGEHRAGATVELLDARLSYSDATRGAGQLERNAFLAVEATDDDAHRISGVDLETELVAAKAIAASETLRVVERARAGDIKGALAQLDAAEKRARTMATKTEDSELTAMANEMSTLRKQLPDLAPPKPAKVVKSKGGVPPSMPTPMAAGDSDVPASMDGAPSVMPAAQSLKRAHSRAFNALH